MSGTRSPRRKVRDEAVRRLGELREAGEIELIHGEEHADASANA